MNSNSRSVKNNWRYLPKGEMSSARRRGRRSTEVVDWLLLGLFFCTCTSTWWLPSLFSPPACWALTAIRDCTEAFLGAGNVTEHGPKLPNFLQLVFETIGEQIAPQFNALLAIFLRLINEDIFDWICCDFTLVFAVMRWWLMNVESEVVYIGEGEGMKWFFEKSREGLSGTMKLLDSWEIIGHFLLLLPCSNQKFKFEDLLVSSVF